MYSSGDRNDTASSRVAFWLTIIVISMQIVLSLVTYPWLPAMVPSHWDAAGHVNGYMPKWLNAIFTPALTIVLVVFIRWLVILGPRLGRENQRVTVSFAN